MTGVLFANKVRLDPLRPSDIGRVDLLLDRLTAYSMAVDGVPKRRDAARQLLTSAPSGRAEAKATFEIRVGREPVGLVDLLRDYPQKGTTYIGLLAIVEDRQGSGMGRAAFDTVEAYAGRYLRARKLRLAVVDTNPVEGFWDRMGFRRTGEIQPYLGEARTGLSILMEKHSREAVEVMS